MKAGISQSHPIRGALISAAILGLAACGAEDQTGEFYTHWDEGGGCENPRGSGPARVSAAGEEIDVCAYPGEYVWISYGASWCSASAKQAPYVRAALRQAPPGTRFFISLTSGREPFVPATDQDVREWVNRYGFDPKVVTREGHSVRTIPQHALIGPDGRTWYRYIGTLREEEILGVLAEFQNGTREPKRFD